MMPGAGSIAFISLGSNIGDKYRYCREGIAALESDAHTVVTSRSSFYRTAPVDYQDQDWFVNAVVRVETRRDPLALLALLNAIEARAGRKRGGIRFGPRTLDMDIIFYGGRIMADPALTLPHPRMHKRRFVLQPLCDIDPTIVHPVFHKTVQYLLDHLDDEGQEIHPYNEQGAPSF
jgi:2-amino-4-hydroxy-6-hydroxymethyldihydropteridine diphosphokinase